MRLFSCTGQSARTGHLVRHIPPLFLNRCSVHGRWSTRHANPLPHASKQAVVMPKYVTYSVTTCSLSIGRGFCCEWQIVSMGGCQSARNHNGCRAGGAGRNSSIAHFRGLHVLIPTMSGPRERQPRIADPRGTFVSQERLIIGGVAYGVSIFVKQAVYRARWYCAACSSRSSSTFEGTTAEEVLEAGKTDAAAHHATWHVQPARRPYT